MADRYWVGGSGSWNSTTKWSATSGGASGASVPTSVDNAIFNASSGSGATHYTVTVTANSTCANLTFTPVAADGVTQFVVDNGFVIAGTFSTSGTQGNRRAWFRSSTYGLMRDMSIATIGTVTDVDFRDIRVTGAGGTLTGTRIGDLKGNVNITASTAKTVYWVTLAGGNWSGDNWAASSGGAASTNNFPLAQDTAVIENTGLNTSATVTVDTAMNSMAMSGVTMSTRTNAMTFATGSVTPTIYGSWTNGSGTTISGSSALTFSGRGTQTINSAGKTFTQGITVDCYGGTVELAGNNINIGSNTLTVNNGTFDTKNFNVTAGQLLSNNSNVRTIKFGSSTLTLSGSSCIVFTTRTNLTFDAGTSQIDATGLFGSTLDASGLVFNNVSFTATLTGQTHLIGTNTYNNVTVSAPAGAGYINCRVGAGLTTITGTLTIAGATAVRRIFFRSDTLGTARTLSVGTLSATDCDFRDITLTGTAAGSSPTRAGDCGGNSGITFPGAKTVYWNLAGAQNWSATGWAASSGGAPALNNFPLPQDTAVFDNTGSAGTVTVDLAWNIGTFDASARTSAMTLSVGTNLPYVYGDWKFGTGVTSSSTTGTISFGKRGTQTITSNGVTFGCNVSTDTFSGTVQLADALVIDSARIFTFLSGTFDAVSYNVTTGRAQPSGFVARTLKMGSGTWTLTGTGTVWNVLFSNNLVFYKNTANIVLSDTSTTARTFDGGGLSYNKLTIGGTTGTSTLTISNSNQFTELASTKTVAHTIDLGSTTQTFGKWTVTGTVGNVVTLTGTGTTHILAGSCTSGIDYLAMGSIGFASTSPGEFYAGANSTGTATVPVYRTAKPADSTRYWVGGTGNWSDTARWSTASGGASGASVPRSHDDVVFDSASNATAYTATINTVIGGVRCKKLTVAGPASGNVTLAGSTILIIHDNVLLPATGLTRTYTGAITLSSNSTGRTITTNGVALASSITVNGVDCVWSLGSALDIGSGVLTLTNGTFDAVTYALAFGTISSENTNSRTIKFGTGTTSISNNVSFGSSESVAANLTVDGGSSQINMTGLFPTFTGNGKTYYDLSFTSTSNIANSLMVGNNTFRNLSFAAISGTEGIKDCRINGNQTVTGTLTYSAGSDATRRHFVRSDSIGTARTLTCAAVSLTDVDFRDITIAGAAAPATGTRLGDCKGNSGVTFTAAANKYWNLAAGGNWTATGWATSSGGTPALNNFPLAQDTCFFEATGLNSGATITVNSAFNIGTVNMSARTTNTMTFATGSFSFSIYGSWINGTGTTISGTGTLTFAGRGSQQITSAGKTWTQRFDIATPGGSVTLQDSFTASFSSTSVLTISLGTFDAAAYNVSLTGASSAVSSISGGVRTIAIGSGTWTIAGSTGWDASTSTNLTITGTGTLSFTSASAKTFNGGSVSYSGITLNQGGAGTLTVTGNNTFANISNTYSGTGATTINLNVTTQTIASTWSANGSAGNVLTITGSPCTLIYSGTGQASNVNYLSIVGVRAYPLTATWFANTTSTNSGSLGWLFEAGAGMTYNVSVSDTATGVDAITASSVVSSSVSDTAAGIDQLAAAVTFSTAFNDSATGSDAISARSVFASSLSDSVTASDVNASFCVFSVSVADTATAVDSLIARAVFLSSSSDTATGSDQITSTTFVVYNVSFSDTATGTDQFNVGNSTFNPAFADVVSSSDTIAVAGSTFNPSILDTTTASDAIVAGSVVPVSFSDTAAGTDTLTARMVYQTAFSDVVAGVDQIAGNMTFAVSFNDTTSATDLFTAAGSVFLAAMSDVVAGSDSFSRSVLFNATFSDIATGSDQVSSIGTFGVSFNDTATGTDQFIGGILLTASFNDTVRGSDVVATQATFTPSIAESAAAFDAISSSFIIVSSISDGVRVLDAPAVAASAFGALVSDQAFALDIITRIGSYNVVISETAVAIDAMSARYLWEVIDNGQTGSWVSVATSQTPNWTVIDDGQSPGWIQINTL